MTGSVVCVLRGRELCRGSWALLGWGDRCRFLTIQLVDLRSSLRAFVGLRGLSLAQDAFVLRVTQNAQTSGVAGVLGQHNQLTGFARAASGLLTYALTSALPALPAIFVGQAVRRVNLHLHGLHAAVPYEAMINSAVLFGVLFSATRATFRSQMVPLIMSQITFNGEFDWDRFYLVSSVQRSCFHTDLDGG